MVRNYFFLSILLIMCLFAQAQAPFLGGAGGGYAMAETSATVNVSSSLTSSVRIYPNPVKGTYAFQIKGMQGKLLVRLFDSQGKMVMRKEVLAEQVISTKGLSGGVYQLVITRNRKSYQEKLVVLP